MELVYFISLLQYAVCGSGWGSWREDRDALFSSERGGILFEYCTLSFSPSSTFIKKAKSQD